MKGDPHLAVGNWLDDQLTRRSLTINDIEARMVDVIRQCSDRSNGTIGRHCISILLSRGAEGTRVRYFSDSATPAAFTPWALIPGAATLSPSITWGSMPALEGAVPVSFERIGPAYTAPDITIVGKSWPRRPEP